MTTEERQAYLARYEETLRQLAADRAAKRREQLESSPIKVGTSVVRKGTTKPVGTVERLSFDRHGRVAAYVRWDRSLMGGSRIGGGTETHSAVLVTGLVAQ